MNATEKVADYVATLRYESIPSEVVARCKEVILDELGVLLRASKSKGASQIITDFVSKFGGRGKCSLIGTSFKTDPISAALANGTLGHDIIELDDVHGPSLTHAAAVIVPAALAVAESEAAGGKALITAVVAAYDIEGRIGIALNPSSTYRRGFHPTSVAGCFGATVAAAKLLGLDRVRVQYALGLAGSQASGLLAWKDEEMHMVKSFQTGIAARDGVTASLLAQMDFLASPRILDGRHNIFDAFSEEHNFAELTKELGHGFEVMRAGLKRSSCCRFIHAPLEAFLKIIDDQQLHPEDMEQVIVKLSITGAPIIDGNPLITHNAQNVLATAAFDRERVTIMAPYSEHRQEDPKILSLAKRIELIGDPELEKLLPAHPGGPTIVEVRTKDGKRFSQQVNDPRGEPSNPLTKEEIEEKFRLLAIPVVGDEKAKSIVNMVTYLEELSGVKQLSSLLKP